MAFSNPSSKPAAVWRPEAVSGDQSSNWKTLVNVKSGARPGAMD